MTMYLKTWLKIVLVLLTIGLPFQIHGEMYKWKDTNGVLHFSDTPPKGGQQTDTKVETLSSTGNGHTGNGYIENGYGMRFQFVPPGEFIMGSLYTICCDDWIKKRPRKVMFTKGFYIQVTEVTQRQWSSVMDTNPSFFKNCGGNCPVEMVSFNDVKEFIQILNEMDTERQYRLPSEAEWEYAARAGSETKYCFGDNKNQLKDYCWYDKNSGNRTHPVARKNPNSWGLYDMHGNVWELCQDGFFQYYQTKPVIDPVPIGISKPKHVIRGGSYGHCDKASWSASRCDDFSPIHGSKGTGFRLILVIKQKSSPK